MLFPGTADGFFGPVCWTCIKASKHWKLNVHGQCGRNISCDLHMEHLNRVVKTAIKGLGTNKLSKQYKEWESVLANILRLWMSMMNKLE